MKTVVFGLCEGRHEIPISDYIFSGVVDPTDVDGLFEIANSAIPEDVTNVIIYVTGLTVAFGAVVAVCAKRGIALEARHFNRDTNEYYAQTILN